MIPVMSTIESTLTSISPTSEIIAELQAGRMVILVDEEDRENEGDLILAADFVTAAAINFMARYGRGLICLTLTEGHCRQLKLPLMVMNNSSAQGTNFTLSIEAAHGVTTGISAADRARTIQAAVAQDAQPADLVQPGHVFPLMAQNGGVLMRAGHTEAGCDLAQLAGLSPAAVICEILKDDGTMARLPDLLEFALQHRLKIGTIADLIQYRSAHESLIRRLGRCQQNTNYGVFETILYQDLPSGACHLAMIYGHINMHQETLVRVHEPLSIFDLLESKISQHSWSLRSAMQTIVKAGSGVIVLLNCAQSNEQIQKQFNKLGKLTDLTFASEAEPKTDIRTYGVGAQILKDLGIRRMKLLAQPRKMPSMAGYGLEITGYIVSENEIDDRCEKGV